jgi:class 3 adenylate cyclase/tetratricopeptide (TPR) repeat protein
MPPDPVALPEGTVTVLSTDLVGSTLLNQRLGDEAATALEREIAELANIHIEKQRGVMITYAGDGLMVAFQSARRAVACAQEIQRGIARLNRSRPDLGLQLRMGLHTGEVVNDEGGLHGETLIIAKRIESVAPGESVYASDTVRGVLGTARGELEDRGEFELKGIDAPWRLWEVPWQDSESTGVLPSFARTPFIARGPERARLMRAVEQVLEGRGGLLLVAGEAGVGKTRLIEETNAEAQRLGLRVLVGRCVDQQGAPPYLPTIEHIEEAARQVTPEVLRLALGENAPEIAKLMPELRLRFSDIPEPVALPPEQERRYLLRGVSEFVERSARITPLVLVFEDLHWADESTLLLIQHLAQRLPQVPVLVVGTYRDSELKPGRPLAQILPALLRQRLAEEIVLRRFTKDGVTALLEGRAGSKPPAALVDLVYSETEGNPFFVEEVFRHLHESGKLFDEAGQWRSGVQIADTEVPRSVGLIIGQRLDRVGDDCRRILTIAALAGKTFRFDLLAAFPGVDEDDLLDALEEGVKAALIEDVSVDREARYAFVHEQIRQTLLSLLSTARRQRLHLRMADAIEALYAGEVDAHAPDIAYHLYQAGAAVGGSERTAHWLLRAAERALDALAYEEALRDLDGARTVLPSSAAEDAVRVLRLRARALCGLARLDEALEAFAEALEIAPSGAERDAVLRARAQLKLDLFRASEALVDIDPLLAAARESGDRAHEVELLLMRSRGLYIRSLDEQGYAEKTRASYEEAYAIAKSIGDKRAMCQALLPTSWFTDYWQDYRDRAVANIEEAGSLATELGDEELEIEAASARLKLLHPGEAHEEALRLRQRLEARRDPVRLKEHLFWMMWHFWMRDEFEQCVVTCDEGIALAEQLGSPPVQYASIKGLALTDLGRFDEAWASFQQEVADEAHPFGRCMREFGVAQWLAALNALDRAEAVAKQVLAEAGRLSRTWMQRGMVDLLTVIAARRGDAGSELSAWVAKEGQQIGYRASPIAAAEAALERGEFAQAVEMTDRLARNSAKLGLQRGRLVAVEWGLRARVGLQRWQDVLDRADAAIREAEKKGFQLRLWRMLAWRASAREATGNRQGAIDDRAAARRLLDAMAERIADPELRAAFEADPAVSAVRKA